MNNESIYCLRRRNNELKRINEFTSNNSLEINSLFFLRYAMKAAERKDIVCCLSVLYYENYNL